MSEVVMETEDLERSKILFKEYLRTEYHKRSMNYERDYNIIMERIDNQFCDAPKTLRSIAEKYNVSVERVAQIFNKAFRCASLYYDHDGVSLFKRGRSHI